MAGENLIGLGSTIGFGDTQSGTFTDVGMVREITPNKIDVSRVDKTHLASANFFREKKAGVVDPGEITFKILHSKTTINTLYGLLRTEKWWRLQFPLDPPETTPSNWKSLGFICGFGAMVPLDDNVETEVIVCLTGKPVFTQGS